MSQPVTIVMLGPPVPFARMRLGNRVHFVPPHQRNAAAAMRLAAEAAMKDQGAPIFDEPVRMELAAEFLPPASWSRKKRAAALLGLYRPGRPDLDNLYKLAADSLSGIVYRDDALVAELLAIKRYSVEAKLIVTVKPILRAAQAAELPLSAA